MSVKSPSSGDDSPCPCGSDAPYRACCGPLHRGTAAPQATPEALMRSRYSAYVLRLSDYLLDSWHPSTRPENPFDDLQPVKWTGLSILAASASDDGQTGTVDFLARFRTGRRKFGIGARPEAILHEVSQFVRAEDGRWLYVDGELIGT